MEECSGRHGEQGNYYISAKGDMVFTEQYHLKRGFCCENTCRHCPFGHL